MTKEEKMTAVREFLKEIEVIIEEGIDQIGEEAASGKPSRELVKEAIEIYENYLVAGDEEPRES